MPKMQAVNMGMNKFCGPAVLSILTGRSTDDCAYYISKVNGAYSVRGVTTPDLIKAADKLGFASEAAPTGSTLFGTLHKLSQKDGVYIVAITGHFICIEVENKKVLLCDNHTKEPIPVESSARLSQRVEEAHRLWKKPEPPPKPVPVLLDKVIQVSQNGWSIDIERLYIYENSMDNRTEYIGELKADTYTDLLEIAEKIGALVERVKSSS
jgi:hypothetical protein